MKMGMTQPAVQSALEQNLPPAFVTIFQNPPVLAGIGAYGCGAILWLLVLSKLPLSAVYPMVSLTIVMVVLVGIFIFQEAVSWNRICGVAVAIAGLILISRAS